MNKGFRFICISFLTAISPLFLSSCSQNSETPVEPTEPDAPAKKKSGCGGSIAAASAIISVVALAGVGLFFIRRKEN